MGDSLGMKFRQTLFAALESPKHSYTTAVKTSFSKKMFTKPYRLKTFKSEIKQCRCKLFGTSSTDQRKWLTNSPGTVLIAMAKGSIFSNTVQATKSQSKTRDNQIFIQRPIDKPCSGSQTFTTESKLALSLGYQIVTQGFYLHRQTKRCCMYIFYTFVFRKDGGEWEEQSTNTRKQNDSIKHLTGGKK